MIELTICSSVSYVQLSYNKHYVKQNYISAETQAGREVQRADVRVGRQARRVYVRMGARIHHHKKLEIQRKKVEFSTPPSNFKSFSLYVCAREIGILPNTSLFLILCRQTPLYVDIRVSMLTCDDFMSTKKNQLSHCLQAFIFFFSFKMLTLLLLQKIKKNNYIREYIKEYKKNKK